MISIFRTIRQQVFNDNKFAKYLIYATGEVFLVVIGILIALAVNNYNEQLKTKAKEKQYLVSMKNELLNNIEVVKAETKRLKNSLDAQRQLISFISSETPIDEDDLSESLGLSFANGFELKCQDGTIKELIYSGGLISISSDTIKNLVLSWEGRMKKVSGQEEGVFEARSKVVEYIMKYGNLRAVFSRMGELEYFESKGK